VHRRRLAPALLLVVALVLAACSGGDTGGSASGPFPSVSGEFGERPELEFPDAAPSTDVQARVLQEGDGAEVAAGDLLLAHYLGQVWDGAIFDNSYDRGETSAFPIGSGRIFEGWDTGLVGQRVGSRVLLTIPPEFGYGPDGNEAAGIKGTDTLAFVVDIVGTFGPQASGAADATPTPEAASVGPEVVGDPGTPPAVSVPVGLAEPAELTTTVLARADGAPVVAGRAVVQYAARFWDNSEGESTWELGQPRVVRVGAGGAFDDLIGVPVGSRVLQELPSTEATPAIALVVDVLAQSAVE
jgi:peptidylprolyl isomerase